MNEDQVSNTVNASTSTDSSATIADLIQSIQTKLNNEQNEDMNNNQQVVMDNNITNTQQDYSEKPTNNLDFSAIGSLLQNIDLSSVLGLLGGSKGSSNNQDKNSGFGLGDIDPKIFSKVQRVIGSLRQEDPKKDLIRSLKPFLRKSRQDKLGEYVTILSIVNAIGIFNDKGSDKDV